MTGHAHIAGDDSEKLVTKGLFIVGGTVKEVITDSEP